MARPGPANDEERLPWLEPYRETMAVKARVARRSHGGLVAVAAALAMLFAAGGGYWIGQRDPEPAVPSAEIALTPQVLTVPSYVPLPPPIVEATPPVKAEPAPVAKKVAVSKPKKPVRSAVRQRKIRNAGIESDRIKAVRAAQERRSAPRPVAVRSWPKMPSPGPAGQVIQLGAFKNPARANAAYRMRLARYPLLGSMPRVVVPVVTKPRGQILYVLRLGTTSRQQSAIVCRNLKASGDHCLVIG